MTMNDNSLMYPGNQAMLWWYECDCTICKATSPNGDSPEEATELALRRVAEPNRVLTFSEVESRLEKEMPVYLEMHDVCGGAWYGNGDDIYNEVRNLYPMCCRDDTDCDDYMGDLWRCWLRKPTTEERANMPWEVQDGD